MKCDCNILSIPYGNPFRIHLCRSDIVPNNPDSIDFDDLDAGSLRAYITTIIGARISVDVEVDNGDLIITIPENMRRATYGIELTGTYESHSWRWKCGKAFRIADTNCESSVQGMESFGVETYYLFDTLYFEIVGDTLHIYTDGHASLDVGTLSLQETANMSLAVKGDSIIATETSNHK